MKSQVIARMEFMATHKWPDAPEHRKYLSFLHAHVFKFEGRAAVSHADRQIEFHDLRTRMHEAVSKIANYRIDGPATFGDMSCEQIGERVLKAVPQLSSITVSEDGQFDAEVTREDADASVEPEKRQDGRIRVYLSSASKGDRALLRKVSDDLSSRNFMVYSPCLGFNGTETPEIRPHIIRACLSTLINWAQRLVIINEGIQSDGCDMERKVAMAAGIPVFDIRTTDDLKDK